MTSSKAARGIRTRVINILSHSGIGARELGESDRTKDYYPVVPKIIKSKTFSAHPVAYLNKNTNLVAEEKLKLL
jgi:hypothetical protein